MSLKERARAARQKEKTETEEKAARILALKSAKTTELALKIFGVEPEEVNGFFATIDGLRFRRIGRGRGKPDFWYFSLLGTCPKCKRVCCSRAIHTLAYLGKMLEDFQPDIYHRCSSKFWSRLQIGKRGRP